MLGVSYKCTWFMMHRLREAMRSGGLEPLGGIGKVVEADETYFGNIPKPSARSSPSVAVPSHTIRAARRTSAPSLRWSSAAARSARSIRPSPIGETVAKIVRENIARETPPPYRRKQSLPSRRQGICRA